MAAAFAFLSRPLLYIGSAFGLGAGLSRGAGESVENVSNNTARITSNVAVIAVIIAGIYLYSKFGK